MGKEARARYWATATTAKVYNPASEYQIDAIRTFFQ